MPTKRRLWTAILLSVVPVVITAVLSALLTDAQSAWYLSLQKPAFNPPDWVFGVVWSIVYLCDAVALFLLFYNTDDVSPVTIGLLLLAAALNIAWTGVFFRLQAPLPALALLGALVAVLVCLFITFLNQNKTSAWLLLPNLLWAIFALILNASIVLLNINF